MAETEQQQQASSHVGPEAFDKKLRWYNESCDDRLTPGMTKLLVENCGVPADGVKDHIYKVRDQAWEVFPFPCIGGFSFLSLSTSKHPRYLDAVDYLKKAAATYNTNDGTTGSVPPLESIPTTSEALAALDNPDPVAVILQHPDAPRLLDVGTCLGQDLRTFRFTSGVPTPLLYGTDIFPGFEAAGHALFLDAPTFAGRFIRANVFDSDPDSSLNRTRGLWDVVTLSLVLHMFDADAQRCIADQIVRLLRDRRGSRVLGSSMGHLEAGDAPVQPPFDKDAKRVQYRQNNETMTRMWEAAVEAHGGGKDRWRIECGYDLKYAKKMDAAAAAAADGDGDGDAAGGSNTTSKSFFRGKGTRKLLFSVERVA